MACLQRGGWFVAAALLAVATAGLQGCIQCGENQARRGNTCVSTCNNDGDCSSNQECRDGVCDQRQVTPPTSSGPASLAAGSSSASSQATSSPAFSSSATATTSRPANSLSSVVSSSSAGTSGTSQAGGCQVDSDCTGGPCAASVSCVSHTCRVLLRPAGTACEDTDPCTHGETCHDNGACVGTAGACLPPAYLASCATTADCSADGTLTCVSGSCRVNLGATCVEDRNCGSSHCVSGACCNDACTGACQACNPQGACVGLTTDARCPALACAALSTPCRTFDDTSTGVCDPARSCVQTSTSACLLYARFNNAPNTLVCRPTAGSCDVAETCVAGSCPADGVRDAGSVCAPAQGVCDEDDTCDGLSPSCPARYKAAGTPCATHGTCDAPEVCTGTQPTCPAPAAPPWTSGNTCTGNAVGMGISQLQDGGTWETFKDTCAAHCDGVADAGCCMAGAFAGGCFGPPVGCIPALWLCSSTDGIAVDGGVGEAVTCGY